ncbi:DUF1702 family protein [Actinokineospora sp.]|uniref:DUF1702 family protein n=1 Tax=Actinokineospora sp. TaxID=1872133 RepID=UPI004037D6FF
MTGAHRGSAPLRLLPPLPNRLVDFERRGFRHADEHARTVLERRARSFLCGYETLRQQGCLRTGAVLDLLAPVDRGFGYEGAAFAAAAADLLRPRARLRGRPRVSHLARLLASAGDRFPHLLHVGAGWVGLAASPTLVVGKAPLDPLLRWLAVDGAGFARAFLRGQRWIDRFAASPHSADPVRAVLYQGVGRALWFVECADADAIAARIESFPAPAAPELWAGVGLAVCYAGGAGEQSLARLTRITGPDRHALAQGAAFAARARQTGGHVPEHTRTGVGALAGVTVEAAADWTRAAGQAPPELEGTVRNYRLWQRRIRETARTH